MAGWTSQVHGSTSVPPAVGSPHAVGVQQPKQAVSLGLTAFAAHPQVAPRGIDSARLCSANGSLTTRCGSPSGSAPPPRIRAAAATLRVLHDRVTASGRGQGPAPVVVTRIGDTVLVCVQAESNALAGLAVTAAEPCPATCGAAVPNGAAKYRAEAMSYGRITYGVRPSAVVVRSPPPGRRLWPTFRITAGGGRGERSLGCAPHGSVGQQVELVWVRRPSRQGRRL